MNVNPLLDDAAISTQLQIRKGGNCWLGFLRKIENHRANYAKKIKYREEYRKQTENLSLILSRDVLAGVEYLNGKENQNTHSSQVNLMGV